MPYFNEEFIIFFQNLEKNNNKEWFDVNRTIYEKFVKKPFTNFIHDIIQQLSEIDEPIPYEAKQLIFRINRDIRFSQDKTPYKTHSSALVSPMGRKNMYYPGMYIEASHVNLKIYGGSYQLDKNQLYTLRKYLCDYPQDFEKALDDSDFKKTYGSIHGEKNKVLPSEFKACAESQPIIYNKNIYYFKKFDPYEILNDNLMDTVIKTFMAGASIRNLLKMALSEVE